MYKAKGGATILDSSILRGICEERELLFNILICRDIFGDIQGKGSPLDVS